MKKLRWFFETAFVILLSFPFSLLPHSFSLKVGELLGLFLFFAWKKRRDIAIDNIEQSVRSGGLSIEQTPRHVARESFKNLGRSFAELAKLYYGSGAKIVAGIDIRGLENYERAIAKNKGIILLTGHCGNWELLAVTASVKVSSIAVVARAQNNPYLNGLLERARARFGNRIIYKQGALRAIFSELRKNGMVGILMDQAVIADEGYIIKFLGRPAWTTKMPVLIARKTGAAILPAFIHREEKGRHVVTVRPEVELAHGDSSEEAIVRDVARCSGCIERYIQEHPTEWLWMHRRWKRAD